MIKISHFQSSEKDQLVKFWQQIYLEMSWPVELIEGTDDPLDYFQHPEGCLLIVKDGQEIVGCGGVKPLGKEDAVMKRFYVAEKYRGTGLAKQLLEELIKESNNRGFSRLVLDVYYKNPRAMRFYEKHGFTKYTPEPSQGWQESTVPEKFVYYFLDISIEKINENQNQ